MKNGWAQPVFWAHIPAPGSVKDTLDLIHKLYRIRTCSRNLPKDTGKERPCLNYHIKQCDAPCQGYISKEDYQKSFGQALDFLGGHYEPLLRSLKEKMEQASEQMEFEKAIEYRELLNRCKAGGTEDRKLPAAAWRTVILWLWQETKGTLWYSIFYQGRKADRKGSFSFVSRSGRERGGDFGRLCKAVLCRNAVYPKGALASVSHYRQRGYQPVADREKGTEGKAGGAPEGRRKGWWSWRQEMRLWFCLRIRNGSKRKNCVP